MRVQIQWLNGSEWQTTQVLCDPSMLMINIGMMDAHRQFNAQRVRAVDERGNILDIFTA